MLEEYLSIFLFFITSLILSTTILILAFFFGNKNENKEKLTPYECGFEPLCDTRNQFDIKFYIVAVLFIIFDIEISFLFPWAITLNQFFFINFWIIFIFLLILTLGFIYELINGCLNWD
jgi:NADH-quinone oxidoreductase subunit A